MAGAKPGGHSQLWLDLITIPLFSAGAGVIVNWSGIYMLFSPVKFHGVYVPGVKTLFPFLPRRVQVLPLWAPGGIIGYQGFIPARVEKMAAMVVHSVVAKIGTPRDFFDEFATESIIDHVVEIVRTDLRPMIELIFETEHPDLWHSLSPSIKEILLQRVDQEMPTIARRAIAKAGESADQLIDLRLLAVRFLTANQQLMNRVAKQLAGPEIRMMIKIGLLGLPFGVILALVLHSYDHIAVIRAIPAWVIIIAGAMLIGISVNLIAIKFAFEPAEPQPRYRYPWRQAKLAKRQPEAAHDFGELLAYEILTFENIADELIHGPRGDRTVIFIQNLISAEIDRILGPLKAAVKLAVGSDQYESLIEGTTTSALDQAPTLLESDPDFLAEQRRKIAEFGAQKLAELPPKEFVDVIYSMIEQDAWLLYAHGAALGALVGLAHIAIFGA